MIQHWGMLRKSGSTLAGEATYLQLRDIDVMIDCCYHDRRSFSSSITHTFSDT